MNLFIDFRRYTEPVIPVGTPLSKAGGKPENKKRWRWWSSGVPPRPPRFRDTALAKPAEVRDDKYQRPRHQEYQTVAGVPFPPSTGNTNINFVCFKMHLYFISQVPMALWY